MTFVHSAAPYSPERGVGTMDGGGSRRKSALEKDKRGTMIEAGHKPMTANLGVLFSR